jgi:hypothetical protein
MYNCILGTVLEYDAIIATGKVMTDDNKVYGFTVREWLANDPPEAGIAVRFFVYAGCAVNISRSLAIN